MIYPLYAAHAAQWQYTKWLRDEAYFRSLFSHAGEQLVLAIARHEGKLAGFRLLGCLGPTVMDLHLSTAKEYEPLDVGPLLVAEPLAWLHEHGYQTFDFLPSGQLEGVRIYKESFGAQPLSFSRASHQGLLTRSLATLWRMAHRPASMVPAS
jgi:CelD/BcsL family acetyltransferase involved in cellulose biosynthesis